VAFFVAWDSPDVAFCLRTRKPGTEGSFGVRSRASVLVTWCQM